MGIRGMRFFKVRFVLVGVVSMLCDHRFAGRNRVVSLLSWHGRYSKGIELSGKCICTLNFALLSIAVRAVYGVVGLAHQQQHLTDSAAAWHIEAPWLDMCFV